MKILQLCNKLPYPPRDGGAVATLNLSRAFAILGHQVTILAMNTPKHFFNPSHIPEELRRQLRFETVPVGTSPTPYAAFRNLFTRQPYHVQRFTSETFRSSLRELLQNAQFDIVQLEGLYLTPYIPEIRAFSNAHIVLRAHNVEHQIWTRLAGAGGSFLKKKYWGLQGARLRNYEIGRLREVDLIAAISENDADFFRTWGRGIPVHIAPPGVNQSLLERPRHPLQEASFFHLGALDWLPNQEGLRWFLKHVWHKVHEAHPHARFFIAGRNATAWRMPNGIGAVTIDGEVEDAHDYMERKGVMIVPLFAGSGMRVKIMEAMALGVPVITTSVGCEGTGAQSGRELLIADDPASMARTISKCIEDSSWCNEAGARAKEFARRNFDNIVIAKGLIAQYQSL